MSSDISFYDKARSFSNISAMLYLFPVLKKKQIGDMYFAFDFN